MGDSTEKQARPGFFKGAKAEFKKISWPDKQSAIKQSIAVAAVSIVVGAAIVIIDVVAGKLVGYLTSFGL